MKILRQLIARHEGGKTQPLHSLLAMCGLAYIAVLPMAHTIALRNLLLVTLLVGLTWPLVRDIALSGNRDWRQIPWPVVAWGAFLLFFPLIAVDAQVAWENLLGQWGKSILAMTVGAGLAWRYSERRWGSIQALAIAAFFPFSVYLSMFVWKALETGSIPWAYKGIEEHHGYLGYAASQAILLLAACLLYGTRRVKAVASTMIALAFISMALIQSRGGLIFGMFAAFLIAVAAARTVDPKMRRQFGRAVLLVLLIGCTVLVLATRTDPRWQNIGNRLAAGWMGDALQIECEGTASIEPAVTRRFGPGPATDTIIAQIQDGDGARIVLLRAGWTLALRHPWGLDGSRQSFQKRLREVCAEPTYTMAHAHNGWLDTALAIGWAGAFLYLTVLIYFLRLGWIYLDPRRGGNSAARSWAVVLVATSIFWLIRALVDSCFRDHMLEMQGFLLAYAAVALRRVRGSPDGRTTEESRQPGDSTTTA